MQMSITLEYVEIIKPLLPLAKRAYGSRNQETPAHEASRRYTELLVEYHEKGGSLPKLAKALDVAYSGLSRRVSMNSVDISKFRSKMRKTEEEILESAKRIRIAKNVGIGEYHDQLAQEYMDGISLASIAKELGLSSANPLYYGVQRSIQRSR
jgi:AraC-like DNA-binding protein